MFPLFNSASLEAHSIGVFTNSQPSMSQTACANSRSNPVYSPVSESIYPYGGYSASKPTVNFFFEESLSFFFVSLFPQAESDKTIANERTKTNNFFILFSSWIFVL